MHARIDHLLSIRDAEPVDAEVAEHIERCPACSAELQRLSSTRGRLQTLPQLDAPPSSWEQIQLKLPRSGPSGLRRSIGMIAAALALVTLSIIVAVAVREDDAASQAALGEQPAESDTPIPAVDATTHVEELVAQSQQLDHLLQKLPDRPRIERVSTAATIDTLEQRIQWLDFQLSYAPDSGLNEEQARRLWRERVELMDSLVKVRYAEAGRTSF